jgi:8-oxo-dGTP pyrophosphatase MutT (NUDIX family)
MEPKFHTSCGAIIISSKMPGKIVLVQNYGNNFTVPMGHTDGKEHEVNTAFREIREETGLNREDLIILKKFKPYTRLDKYSKEMKIIKLYLMLTNKIHLASHAEDITKVEWFDYEEVPSYMSDSKDIEFFNQVLPIIKNYEAFFKS